WWRMRASIWPWSPWLHAGRSSAAAARSTATRRCVSDRTRLMARRSLGAREVSRGGRAEVVQRAELAARAAGLAELSAEGDQPDVQFHSDGGRHRLFHDP